MATADDETPFDKYREQVDRPLVRLFREYSGDRWAWLVGGMLANVVAQVASLFPPVVLGAAIDALFNENGTYRLPFVPASLIPEGEVALFWFSVALIAGSFVVTGAFTWIYGVVANRYAHGVMHAVRSESFARMLRLDAAFFDDKQTGEVMSVLNEDTGNLELFLDNALMNSLRLIVMVGGITVILVALNAQLAVVTLLAVPIMAGFTWWFMRAVAPRYRSRQSSVAAFNTRVENGISGIELTKTTASEDREADRVRGASRSVFDDTMSVLKLSYFYRPGMELLAGLSFAATFVVGGYWILFGAPWILTGELRVGTFVTFVFMTQRFVAPLAEVSNIVDQAQNARASAERVFGLADLPVRIEDREDAVALDDPRGRVEYEDVTFAYPDFLAAMTDAEETADGDGDETDDDAGRRPDGGAATAGRTSAGDEDADVDWAVDDPATADAEPVIRDVSLSAEPGDTVAFVGSTGAGKSTLCRLLMRLYDVTDGAVRIDGHDVRDLELASLRRSVGYVSQEAFLFDGTIADNVRYGRFGASREDVVAAATAAQAHEFITDLPDGYDTRVGERGVKLSGGQRQRIAIARAILQDPPVLVLDEATSDVDTDTERRIQRSLDRLTEERTTFVVAHRLSTVVDADLIVVLEDGEAVERGSHEALLARGGRYADLWAAQTGEE